jgi:hypothetical protein
LFVFAGLSGVAGAQQAGSGARNELLQSLVQRYPLTNIGPSALGLRGSEDTVRQPGTILVVLREGLQGSLDRKQMPVCLIRGDKLEISATPAGQAIAPGARFYVISIYVGLDVVEFGLLSASPPAAGSSRMWARAVFAFPAATLHNGERPAVFRQIERWLQTENAVIQVPPVPAAPPAANAPAAAPRIRLEPGMTRGDVVRALGEPQREVSFGTRMWLVYAAMVAYFEDDKLKSVENNGRPGRVRLRTEPEGAEVYLGEQLVGQGPTTLDLPAGRYVFIVRLPGYTPWRKEVDVLPGADLTLNVRLEK